MSNSRQPSLISHFEPQTLTQLGVGGGQIVFSSSHQPTHLAKTGKDALLAKLPLIGNGELHRAIDVDLSCLIYDKNHELLDKVWYGKLRSQNDAVRHLGDSFKGSAQGHTPLVEETIVVRLSELSKQIHRIIFAVSSYHKQPLAQADMGIIRLSDNEGHLIHDLMLDALPKDCTTLHAWQMERLLGDWRISAIMANVNDGILGQLI